MKHLLAIIAVVMATHAWASADWSPVKGSMLTEWGAKVTPENAWREYPRPQMVREGWSNLNGLWHYAVTDRGAAQPQKWVNQILVPFALETPLSGVGQRLEDNQALWYQRTFKAKSEPNGRTLLHFEGVDYACRVWVNGELAGSHVGGNLPFYFDVTDLVKKGDNEIVLRVFDETDAHDRYQLRGKQQRDNEGIWYTPSSGIWQTVWLESVPETYLSELKMSGEASGRLSVQAKLGGDPIEAASLRVTVLDDGDKVANKVIPLSNGNISVGNATLWSPENPHLYDLEIELLDKTGKRIDTVRSYVGFRTIGKRMDDDGNWRFTLNGKDIFHLGPLDQGWWPDGFLNPPSDDAIVFEMEYLKAAGFNMIRKHKKVEPRRYYYHADRMGFLVWQDQVSGGAGPNEWPKWKKLRADSPGYEPDHDRMWSRGDDLNADWPDWAHQQYMAELKIMIDTLYSHPSIVMWTTFNERWGQHRSMEVGRWAEAYDPTRYLNIASGGNFFEVGDIADEHNYPHPAFPLDNKLFDDYVKVLGEFGGHGWPVKGHQWNPDMENWGYGGLPKTLAEYTERYRESMRILGELKEKGIAAGVYTQTTDVEGEINGLMTYDREVIKIPAEEARNIHAEAGLLD